jgi:hypothetical protein
MRAPLNENVGVCATNVYSNFIVEIVNKRPTNTRPTIYAKKAKQAGNTIRGKPEK